MAEAIVIIVLGKLGEAVVQEKLFFYHVPVEQLQRDLKRIECALKDADSKQHKNERVKKWESEIQEVGYMIEDTLDKFLAEDGGGKRNIGNEIEEIHLRLREIEENKIIFGIVDLEESSGASIKLPVINPDIEKVETIVNLVLSKLADTVIQEALSFLGVRNKVVRVQRDLTWIQSFLKDAAAKRHKDDRVKQWANEIQDVRYLIEGILDKLLAEVSGGRAEGLRNIIKRLGKMTMKPIVKHKVGKGIDKIQKRIREITEMTDETTDCQEETSSWPSVEQPTKPVDNPDIDDMEVVGFEVDRKTIVNQLIDASITRRSVILIVGAGGSGKTTLAKEMYKSAEVKHHFDISMWLTISQDYKLIDILNKMLNDIGSERQNEGEEYLITELNKCMTERKYLVVLDDVWLSNNVWTLLQDALPNANNGSRVLITTRFINIAQEIDMISKPHVIQPLNEEESKELLLKKVFPNKFANECPNDLFPLVAKFTKKCGGWPLPLVVLGEILFRKNPNYITWNDVMQNMDWQNMGSDVMFTSYEDLPTSLKYCFMYFGVFPEGYRIKATTLIQLWVAEGFIRQDGTKVLEDIAESYLEELVQRCMVHVSRRSCIGKIKYCNVHDLLRELAIQKAKERNFLTVVLKNETKLSSSTCARRVALHVFDDKMIELASTNLRSLISFAHVPNYNKFPTIRVLYIGTEHYKYLTGTNYCQLPTGIERSPLTRMVNLQMVHVLFCKIHYDLHPSFWCNKKLRHINLSRCLLCEGAPEGPPSSANLPSLLTLKGVRTRQDWVSKLPNFPYLRKLGIVIPEDVKGEPLINLLSNLNYLHSLHIEMSGSRRMTFPSCISAFRNHNHLYSFSLVESIWPRKEVADYTLFPPKLVKLTLEHFCFEEDPMPQLEKLPNLRVLKLSGKIEAADGKQMICSTGGFAHLEGLLLEVRNLEEWKIEEGAMPMLNQLVLKRCRKLQVVPDLQYLVNLQQLTVHHCLDQFNSRLKGEDNWKIKHIPSVSVCPWLSS